MIEAKVVIEQWPLKVPFVIARSSREYATVVYLEITDGVYVGRAECQPNTRYGEDAERVCEILLSMFPVNISELRDLVVGMSSKSAANALDCALLDLQAKQTGLAFSETTDIPIKKWVQSVYTLSVGKPEEMAQKALQLKSDGVTHLKLKLAGNGDGERVRAVRAAVPGAHIIVDANEAWTPELLQSYMPVMKECDVEMVEQPLPAGQDDILAELERLVPVCADESCHGLTDVKVLKNRYDAINIKLDKTGGYSAAIQLYKNAKRHNMQVMVGCMLGTSLAMAPACYLACGADYIDLDGPALLKKDRKNGLYISGETKIYAPEQFLWG